MRAATVLVRNLAASETSLHRWPAAVLTAREAIRRGAMQKLAEFAPLLAILAAKPPRAVLEIGTGTGGAFYAWCRVARPDATLVVVDLPGQQGDPPADEATLRSYLKPAQTGHFLWADSHDPETRERAVALAPHRRFDLVFIDGDHSYEGVKRDFETYGPRSRVVVLHDIVHHPQVPECQVERFWRELPPYRRREIVAAGVDVRGWGEWGGIGLVSPAP